MHDAFPELDRLDAGYAREDDRVVLLQVRAAAFPIRRNELLSLANHREILGDPPSPWVVAALERAGESATAYFAEADPRTARDARARELSGGIPRTAHSPFVLGAVPAERPHVPAAQ